LQIHNNEESGYSPKLIKMAKEKKHFGRMNDPTSSAWVKGPCGDEMEFYLVVKNNIIEEIKFYTEGCIATHVCGSMTAQLVKGKKISEALDVSPKKVMDFLRDLPEEHKHCPILSVSTLYKAIADYLLKI